MGLSNIDVLGIADVVSVLFEWRGLEILGTGIVASAICRRFTRRTRARHLGKS